MKRRDLIAGGLAVAASGALKMPRARADAPPESRAGAPMVLGGHLGSVMQVAYSPDGRWLLASAMKLSESRSPIGGETRLWDARTGKLERVLLPDIAGQKMQWTPDGRTLALPGMRWQEGHGDGSVQLWDTSAPEPEKWAAKHTLEGANASANLGLSPEGKYLLVGIQSPDIGGAAVWEVESGEQAAQLSEQSGFLAGATFAPGGRSMFTLSWRGAVDKFGGTAMQWWDIGGAPEDWELARVTIVPQRLVDAAFSPDGKRLAWVRWKDDASKAALVVADAQSGEVQHELTSESWFFSPCWSPDGKSLAISHITGALDLQTGRAQAQVFETQDWKLAASLGQGKRMITALAWAPDGKSLALGGGENAVEIYKL